MTSYEEQRARPVNAEDLLEVARAELKTAVMLEGTYCAQRDAALAREKALADAVRRLTECEGCGVTEIDHPRAALGDEA